MPVSRRTALTIIGGIAIGYTTASAAGAFDRVELERDITIEVGGDAESLLAVEPHHYREVLTDGPDVGTDEDGLVYVSITGDTLNDEGTTDFYQLLLVSNNGSQDITLDIELLENGVSPSPYASAFPDYDPEASFGSLAPDGSVDVGMRFEVEDADAIESIDTIRITAESD